MTSSLSRPLPKYVWAFAQVWGVHPVIFRLSDGYGIAVSHSTAEKDVIVPLPSYWRKTKERWKSYLKPVQGFGLWKRLSGKEGSVNFLTQPEAIKAADLAFAIAEQLHFC